jgi:hypothetical protein
VFQVLNFGNDIIIDHFIDGKKNDIFPVFLFFAHLHPVDVDAALTQGGGDGADNAGNIFVLDQTGCALPESLPDENY